MVRYGDKFQVGLRDSGIITFSYFGLDQSDLSAGGTVGLIYSALNPKNATHPRLEYQSIWEKHQIRNGVVLRFELMRSEGLRAQEPVDNDEDISSLVITGVLAGVVVTFLVAALFLLCRYGFRRPTSIVGSWIVRLRMFKYKKFTDGRMRHGSAGSVEDEPKNESQVEDL